MKKVNINQIQEDLWESPKGRFAGAYKNVSVELGRKPDSQNLDERHPFDLEICRIPAGKTNYPYHSHSAQWELYHVLSGRGVVRHQDGTTPIEAGDAFLFEPNQPHQIVNDSGDDLLLCVIADNPIGESGHYPDSQKWLVRSPARRIMRAENLDYFDGEE